MDAPTSKVALITGASAGIGEAACRRLVRAGWRVAFTARRADRITALAAAIDPDGAMTLPLAGDVTIASDRERWMRDTLARWGRIDALVNNAGYGLRGPIELASVDDIRRNFETNVFALIALTQLVIPILRSLGGGRIVNVGSVAGRIARPLSSVYDATKHALNAVSDGLRGELASSGIQVVVIEPGFIRTEFIDAANRESKRFSSAPGIYAAEWDRQQRGVKRARRFAAPPDAIARLIERAVTAHRPRSRYAGPLHAKFLLALRWLLPDRAFDFLFSKL